MAKTPKEDLLESLKDIGFAKLYGTEDAKVNFAITLMKARRKAKLTQTELASKLGVCQSYVAKLESGEANPTIGTVGSLLAALGLGLVTDTAPLAPEPVFTTPTATGSTPSDDGGVAAEVTEFLHTVQPASAPFIAPDSAASSTAGERVPIGGAV